MNNNEKCIGNILYAKLPIEWMKFNMYIEADKYRNIPMLVFRLQESCPKYMLDNLKKSIENFEGILNWKLFKDPLSRKGNYLLTVSALEDMHRKCYIGQIQYNQKDYFGVEKYKKYCDCAIYDIPMLAKHIEKLL